MTERKNDKELVHVKGNTLTRFIDGAISGFVSGAALQPLQVIKTSMQVSPIEKNENKIENAF